MTVGIVAVVAASLVGIVSPAANADEAAIGGDYVPLDVQLRLLDTRNDTGGAKGARPAASTLSLPVLGKLGIPTAGVSAVLVDVSTPSTTDTPTVWSWLTLFADGTPRPIGVHNATAAHYGTKSNSVIVPVGTNGKIAIYNSNGPLHLMVDVEGYFTSAPSSTANGGFVPVDHTRVMDTSTGLGAPKAKVAAAGSVTLTLPSNLVPADATSAYVELTALGAAKDGWIGEYPTGMNPVRQSSALELVQPTTSAGTAVKLGAGGKLTLVNNTAGDMNMQVTVEGYFSNSSSTGAGYRAAQGRLLELELAANATVDVPATGVYGLPTKGVSAVAVNLTAYRPAATGALRVWPVGGSENTGVSVANFPAGGSEFRSSLAMVKPGTDGMIRVRNASSGTLLLWVDLEGFFAKPIPSVPVEKYARSAVWQSLPSATGGVGAIEYSYVDNIGRLMYAHQADLNDFDNVVFTPLSTVDEAFTGQPAITQGAAEGVTVVAQNTDSNLWSRTQAKGAPGWGDWNNLGGSMASGPIAVRLADDSEVDFATDSAGKLWQRHQQGITKVWTRLGDASFVGVPTAVPYRDGVQLFALDSAGAVHAALYRAGATTLIWTDLAGEKLNGSVAAVAYPGGKFRVFARAEDGTIVTKGQETPGNFDAEWTPVGDLKASGSPAAILDPVTGRTEVVARGPGNELWSTGETVQASGAWRPWVLTRDATDQPTPFVTDPTILSYTGATQGARWAVVVRNVNNVTHVYQVKPEGTIVNAGRKAAVPPKFIDHALPAPPR